MNEEDAIPMHDRIERLIEGGLPEDECRELIAQLRTDPEALRKFSMHLALSEALADLRPERIEDENIRIMDLVQHVAVVAREEEDDFVSQVIGRVVPRKRRRWPAIAALIAVSAVAGFLLVRPFGDRSPVASLVELNTAGTVISSREIQAGYRHKADSGLFRLEYRNGAVVGIEGPANFEVASATSLKLDQGRLNAWCPTSAHGFQVITSSAVVKDLGTSFGVSAHKDGSADYLVLEGVIEVTAGKDTRKLEVGDALSSSGSKGLTDLAFQPAGFAKTWPLTFGILSTKGAVVTAPPGTPDQLISLEDNDSVFVFPEKRDVPFEKPIHAELIAPGQYPAKGAPGKQTVAAQPGIRVGSYLIRYNPVGRQEKDFRRFEGEVRFDRPVVAVCTVKATLDETDGIFSTTDWSKTEKSGEFRGIDLDQPERFTDRVTLSEDRQTVKILFYAGVSTDDVRVIVEEAPVAPTDT